MIDNLGSAIVFSPSKSPSFGDFLLFNIHHDNVIVSHGESDFAIANKNIIDCIIVHQIIKLSRSNSRNLLD